MPTTRVAVPSEFHKLKLNPAFKAAKKFKLMPNLPMPTAADGSDPVLTAMIRKLGGDRNLAKQVMRLADIYPVGTIPEFLVYLWLQKRGYSFEYQVEMMGGWGIRGGLIPDFIIYKDRTNADAILCQGNYWHSLSKKGFQDSTTKYRLLGQLVRNATIKRVIEVWESDLVLSPTMRDTTMMYAMVGLEMRGIGGA